MALTAERLRELLDYDPATGLFRWKVTRSNKALAGNIAGSMSKAHGCIDIGINRRVYKGHRLAFFWMTGRWPERGLDHADCNPGNNAWLNLREATKSQNGANTPKVRPNSRSGLKGAFLTQSGKYCSKIGLNGKVLCLGTFSTKEEAHAAYLAAAIEHFGEFARV